MQHCSLPSDLKANGGSHYNNMEHIFIELVAAQSPQRASVASFVRHHYEQRLQLVPFLPEIIFAAFQQESVVGAIGLEFSEREDCPIPCEQIFSFDRLQLALPASRTRSVQYSRWCIIDPSITKKIVHTATLYAIGRGKHYGWCELKPLVAKRLAQMGVMLYEVADARIQLSAVDASVARYYTTKPYPKLYQFHLTQLARAVQ